jgi:PAS domain S-box-containing protein
MGMHQGEATRPAPPGQADDRFDCFVDASPMGIHLYRLEGDRLAFAGANRAAERILGLSHGPLVGLAIEEAFPPLAATEVPARYREVVRTGVSWSTEQVTYQDDRIAGAFEVHAFRPAPGELVVMFLDISPRKRVEEALRRSEEKYRLVVEGQQDLVVKLDLRGNYLFASEPFCRAFGVREEELLGRPFQPLVHEEDVASAAAALAALQRPPHVAYAEQRARTTRGWRLFAWTSRAVLDEQGRLVAFVGTGRDVTEQRAMEERLRQGEKLHAIGQLAGGVAHDFNNQLTGILGNAELLLESLAGAPDLRAAAEAIRGAAERSARLTAQLLAFARKGQVQTVPVEAHQVVADVLQLLRRSLDKRIALTSDLGAVPSVVAGDPAQLHNALLNLALNARDAMPEGGTLRFSTRVAGAEALRRDGLVFEPAPGPLLELAVSDTGVGMDAETLARIFDPFFTTKPPGQGTGLGLAAVYGTLKSHRGGLAVQSAPGQGTTVTLWLPLAGVAVQPEPSPAAAGPAPGRARVLVVDDERLVRETLRRILQRAGHEVVLASRGEQAVAAFREGWRDLDAVILDVVMPDLNGPAVLARLREVSTEVPVILSSGYSPEGEIEAILEAGQVTFLQKPYQVSEVRAAVDEAMARRRGRRPAAEA